jgi:hypothetical protein
MMRYAANKVEFAVNYYLISQSKYIPSKCVWAGASACLHLPRAKAEVGNAAAALNDAPRTRAHPPTRICVYCKQIE